MYHERNSRIAIYHRTIFIFLVNSEEGISRLLLNT